MGLLVRPRGDARADSAWGVKMLPPRWNCAACRTHEGRAAPPSCDPKPHKLLTQAGMVYTARGRARYGGQNGPLKPQTSNLRTFKTKQPLVPGYAFIHRRRALSVFLGKGRGRAEENGSRRWRSLSSL